MGQILCNCSACGAAVRRDDGALAQAEHQPKRLVFRSGVSDLLTLDYCNTCCTETLEVARVPRKRTAP